MKAAFYIIAIVILSNAYAQIVGPRFDFQKSETKTKVQRPKQKVHVELGDVVEVNGKKYYYVNNKLVRL